MRMNHKKPKMSMVDKVVNYISPVAGVKRLQAKAAIGFMSDSGYINSNSPKKSMRGWNPFASSADDDTLPKVEQSRADSRDLFMNSPIATGALRRAATNVIGGGLILQSRIDKDALGLTTEQASDWERKAEREFDLWASSKDCDISRMQNFGELQELAFLNTLLSGDVFVALPYQKIKNVAYDLKIKIIEADYCCNPNGQMDTSKIAGGIEIDKYGAPKTYHFMNGSSDRYLEDAVKWIPVDVFGKVSGRRNVLHIMKKDRPGQRRGMPMLAPVIESLKNISRLSEAELMGSILSSFFTVFVKSDVPGSDGLAGTFGANDSVATDQEVIDDTVYEMGSGNIVDMLPGDSIDLADPKRPNKLFEPFFVAIVKQIGAAIEIPFEQLMLHFSSSYSAARGCLLEAWKYYRKTRIWFTVNFNTPIYIEWLTEAVVNNRIIAPGFLDDSMVKKSWCGCTWGGSGMGQIDPLRESKAITERLNNMTTSYEDEHMNVFGGANGRWETIIQRRAREEQLIVDNGLVSNPDNTVQGDEKAKIEKVIEDKKTIEEVAE